MEKKSFILLCSLVFLGYTNMYAQQKIAISGSVVNESGQPLQGATIVESSTNNTILTNQRGEVRFTVSSGNATLEVSFTGYTTAVVPVNNQKVIQVLLKATT